MTLVHPSGALARRLPQRPPPGVPREAPARTGSRPPPAAVPYAGGIAFVAGRSVPELVRHLERARQEARAAGGAAYARELDTRLRLIRGLLLPGGAADLRLLCLAKEAGPAERFGYWVTCLGAAWYADAPEAALRALGAAPSPDALASAGDLMLFHLFATLALARWAPSASPAQLAAHCASLRDLDARCQATGGAMHALALAACARRRGEAMAALTGFECAAADAARLGLHWLATLAWEQAVLQAQEAGLHAAALHYRQQCLEHYRCWGALGRLQAMQLAWGCTEGAARFDLAIAHELNQPLAAIALHATAAGKWLQRATPDLGRALDSLAQIGAAGRQAGEIVRGLQRAAANLPIETAAVDLDALVREAVKPLEPRLHRHGIALELALGVNGCTTAANRVQLQQVLTNLVVNAIEAHAGQRAAAPRIRIETRRGADGAVELAVSDNGPGIAPADRDRVFACSFSTKPRRAGKVSGMGLSICLSILGAHGGDLRFEPGPDGGACFRARLPDGASQGPAR